jgi:hypothetical protein
MVSEVNIPSNKIITPPIQELQRLFLTKHCSFNLKNKYISK